MGSPYDAELQARVLIAEREREVRRIAGLAWQEVAAPRDGAIGWACESSPSGRSTRRYGWRERSWHASGTYGQESLAATSGHVPC